MHKIETERLLLRPYTADDVPAIVRLLNHWEIVRHMRIPYPVTAQHTMDFVDKTQNPKDPKSVIGGIFRQTPHGDAYLIGGIGLHNTRQPAYELGYWIGKAYWGNGYAYEASFALLKYGINTNGIDAIISSHDIQNPKSGRILKKLGFEKTGTKTETLCPNRTLHLMTFALNPILYKK